jgi:hypothetical protein
MVFHMVFSPLCRVFLGKNWFCTKLYGMIQSQSVAPRPRGTGPEDRRPSGDAAAAALPDAGEQSRGVAWSEWGAPKSQKMPESGEPGFYRWCFFSSHVSGLFQVFNCSMCLILFGGCYMVVWWLFDSNLMSDNILMIIYMNGILWYLSDGNWWYLTPE